MKAPIEVMLANAIGLHEVGRVHDAEKLYRAVLQQNPRHAGALYLLGMLNLTAKRYQRAADLIGRSLRSNPDFLPAYLNLGLALAALKRPADALRQYDAALAREPAFGRRTTTAAFF